MPSKILPEQRKMLQRRDRNEAVILLSSASGRIVGFIVDIGRHDIPFAGTAAEEHHVGWNILDTLLDGSFLPSDSGWYNELDDLAYDDEFYNLSNRIRRSIQVRDFTGKNLSELEFFMRHIHLTEN